MKWSEGSSRGERNGKPGRCYQHMVGDCLYTLFIYDELGIPSDLEMCNIKGSDYFSLIVRGKTHAERIISAIEGEEDGGGGVNNGG